MNTVQKPLNAVITKTIIFLLFAITSYAQMPLVRTVSDASQWQNRANRLTEDIISESSAVPNSERAIYFALLAKMWLLKNPEDARMYLRRAVDLTLTSLDFTDGLEFRREADNWRKTVFIIVSVDQAAARSLAEKLAKELSKRRDLGTANADAAVVTALQLVDTNPRLAFSLGTKSLSYGISPLLHILISRLGERDPKLGQDLIRLAFNAGHGRNRYEFLGDVSVVLDVFDGKPALAVTQRGYFELLADLLAVAAGTEPDREARCEAVSVVLPWLKRFGSIFPERLITANEEVQGCFPYFYPLASVIVPTRSVFDEPRDADDLLESARNAGDLGLKSHYYYLAISKLALDEAFEKIISVLDGMTSDKAAVGETVWINWRIEYAVRAVIKAVMQDDSQAANRIFDRTPIRLRPFVRLRVVNELSPADHRDFVFENLESIRKEFGSFDFAERTAARGYLSATRLYFQIKPSDAAEVFADAVKFINKTDRRNPDFLPEKDYAPAMDYVSLPADLLQYDENSTFSSLSNISSRRSRVRLKLGLLESCMERSGG